MNASKFMDKQIMDLSRSSSTTLNNNNNKGSSDFLDLMNPQSEDESDNGSSSLKKNSINSKKDDDILPNYDFHPIPRSSVAGVTSSLSSSDPTVAVAAATSPPAASRSWNFADSKPISAPLRSYGSLDAMEPEKVVKEKAQKVNDSAIMSEIDRTMKKYMDSVLHAIDGLAARVSQLESRTCQLEYGMDDLKVRIGNNHGSTDGKMRQLENILLEVQSGMQDIKDKQEVMNGHMQLAKLQISKVEKSFETANSAQPDPAPQLLVSAPPQQPQYQQFPMSTTQPVPALPPNAPLPPQQNMQPPAQPNIQPSPPVAPQFLPAQIPPVPQQDSYLSPPTQTQGPPNQQYQVPPPAQPQQQTPTPPPQPQQYQPPQTPPYPQPAPPPQQQHPPVAPTSAPPQFQPPMSHHPEENPYVPPQSYPSNLRQPTSQPSSGVPLSQPYYGSTSPAYDPPPPSGRPGAGYSSGYAPPSGPSEPYPYNPPPPSHYGSGSSIKPQPQPQPHSPGGGSGNYPKIPTARILPQAIPTATGVNDGSSSGGSGNRVPIDDVIDKVTSMGFPREHVRATVRRLTENGQSVDLNVVLDKLMNDGDMQPQRGWFGR